MDGEKVVALRIRRQGTNQEEGPPTSQKKKKATPQQVRKMLREAASKKVQENKDAIAEALYQVTVKGNINGVKMLLDLAEGPKKAAAKKRKRKVSTARALSEEPEWQEPKAEV